MDTTNPNLVRGEMLFSQGRFDLAEKELRQAIGVDPNDGSAYSYLAICLAARESWQEATEAAQRGVGLDPQSSYAHYALASVLQDRKLHKQARASAEEALRLEPYRAAYWAMLASIELSEERPKQALEAAEKGLELDPEHEACINIRAVALTKTGRRAEAGQAIGETLAKNPLNAQSHANMGWTLLHQNNPRQAMDHFREALRLEPGMEWARLGIAEAMKARNPIYRLFLAYFMLMNRLGERGRWGVILGGYLLYQVLGAVSKSNPGVAPYLAPVLTIYMVFAIGTIVSIPLFNLFLLCDRFGRHTLSTSQKWAAGIFGVFLLPAAASLAMWATVGGDVYKICAIFTGFLIVPVALAGLAREGTPRKIMVSLAAVFVVMGLGLTVAVILEHVGHTQLSSFKTAKSLISVYMLGCIASTWIYNIVGSMGPKPKY